MSLSLRATAAAHGDAPALIFDDHQLTWAQLAPRVAKMAARIVADRHPVVLEGRRDEASLLTVLAAIEAGATRIHGTALGIGDRVFHILR